jgi:hypothetical protein
MADKQGITYFAKNIEPIMQKCKNGEKLTKGEQYNIVQFYLEALHYIANS